MSLFDMASLFKIDCCNPTMTRSLDCSMCDGGSTQPMVGIGARFSDELNSDIKIKVRCPRYVSFVPKGSTAQSGGMRSGDLICEVKLLNSSPLQK